MLAALKETRWRLSEALKGVTDDLVDRTPPSGGSSIGSVLYHIALIEADWVIADILGTQDTDWPRELFPLEDRDATGALVSYTGETIAQHMSRLEAVRKLLVDAIGPMSAEELHQLREREAYDLSAAWALHHLMQHEAEHRSQIGAVREALERA